jgi:hypothetical protein
VHLLWFKMCRRWQHGYLLYNTPPINAKYRELSADIKMTDNKPRRSYVPIYK